MKGNSVTIEVTATLYDDFGEEKERVSGSTSAALDLKAVGGLNVNMLTNVAIDNAIKAGQEQGLFPKLDIGPGNIEPQKEQ